MDPDGGNTDLVPNPQQNVENREEEGMRVIQEHDVPGVEDLIYPERVTFQEELYPDALDVWRQRFPITPQFEDELRRARELLESYPTSSSDWINIIRSIVTNMYDNRNTFNAM